MKALVLLICLCSPLLSSTDREKLEELQKYNAQLSAAVKSESIEHIEQLEAHISRIKKSLKQQPGADGTLIASKTAGALSEEFDLLDFKMYSWTANSNRVVARIKNRSLEFAEWVKLYFYFYKNGALISDDFTYIDYSSYGSYGVLPFYQSSLEAFVAKVDFDSVQIDIDYEKTSGEGHFLCDQILQLVSNTLTPSYSGFDWEGVATNTSTYSLDFPKLHAAVFRQDSLIDVDYTYLDVECQGNRTVIIDYIIEDPIEAQKIVLRNCSSQDINLGGWYMGDKDDPYRDRIPAGEMIAAHDYKEFTNADITFTIDEQDEIIYLFNATKSLVDQWTKDENDFILQPLTSSCYDSYLDLAEPYDVIKYHFSYSLHSLAGRGNITPNAPAFENQRYDLAPNAEYGFNLFVIDGNHDDMEVQIDWGDDQRSGWLGPFESKSQATISYTFTAEGDYWISARAKDGNGSVSAWSDSILVFVSQTVPVELSSFSALPAGEHVRLRWSTASESNNLGFTIERSQNKSSWHAIGFVKGLGTNAQTAEYSFLDTSPLQGSSYYRLQQMDFDGSRSFSEIVQINTATPSELMLSAAYPNPFNSTTKFTYELAETMPVEIAVYSINGLLMETIFRGIQNAGVHSASWNSVTAPSGVYFIRVDAGLFSKRIKCLILK